MSRLRFYTLGCYRANTHTLFWSDGAIEHLWLVQEGAPDEPITDKAVIDEIESTPAFRRHVEDLRVNRASARGVAALKRLLDGGVKSG